MDKMKDGIVESVQKERKTQERITRILKCLEAGNYILATKVCDLAMTEAEFIQDRLTIMYLKQIAYNGTDELTKAILDKAYNIEENMEDK